MTCSKRITRTGLATKRNRCGCECITVDSPDDAYCIAFAFDVYEFQLFAANSIYTGIASAPYSPTVRAEIVCSSNRLVLTISDADTGDIIEQYKAPATGCCIPTSMPQTFTRVGSNEDYPATLDLDVCPDNPCENPLVSGTCEDPVPCAYRIINLCSQLKSIDVLCEADDATYTLNAWLLETVTLRRRCSNGDSETYFALAPLNTYLATAYFGDGGGSLAKNAIGPDWRDIQPFGACVPCSWFDGPSLIFGVGGTPTNCSGGGGAAIPHQYADDGFYEASGGSAFSPLTAFALDTVAGALTPNHDLFAGDTAGDTTQPGTAAAWGFPRFPAYALVEGTEWNCRGCNRLKKQALPYDEPDQWKMPEYIEIVPVFEPADMPCQTGDQIAEPNGGYDTKAHRVSCCDGYCECVPGYMSLVCGEESFSCEGSFCKGVLVGQESPVGPSRQMCCDFTIAGTLRHICLVAYCDGTNWKIDVYCDNTYESTVTAHRLACCPLSFDFKFNLSCADCTACGALNTTCDNADPCLCFDPDPATLSLHVETATTPCGAGAVVTGDYVMYRTFDNAGWTETDSGPGTFSGANVYVECRGGKWRILCSRIDTGDIDEILVDNLVDCPGLLLTGSLRFSSCDFTVTITL